MALTVHLLLLILALLCFVAAALGVSWSRYERLSPSNLGLAFLTLAFIFP